MTSDDREAWRKHGGLPVVVDDGAYRVCPYFSSRWR